MAEDADDSVCRGDGRKEDPRWQGEVGKIYVGWVVGVERLRQSRLISMFDFEPWVDPPRDPHAHAAPCHSSQPLLSSDQQLSDYRDVSQKGPFFHANTPHSLCVC